MKQVMRSGAYLETDNSGFFVNSYSEEAISGPWDDLACDLRSAYLQHFGEAVHSMYVRGSVARDRAIPGVSDIDIVVVLDDHSSGADPAWQQALKKQILTRHPFCVNVDTTVVAGPDSLDAETKFLLKTQGVCIYGTDIIQSIPKYRPESLCAIYLPLLKRQLEETLEYLQTDTMDYSFHDRCRRIMKQLLRVGGVLAARKKKAYTPDLYLCYEAFSEVFPRQESNMRIALELAVNQNRDKEFLLSYLESFGTWLVLRTQRALDGKDGIESR